MAGQIDGRSVGKGRLSRNARRFLFFFFFRSRPPRGETALFNFTCKRYGQFDELFSSRSTFSLSPALFLSLSPSPLPPSLCLSHYPPFSPLTTYILSLSLPLDGAAFHPSLRSSFRCKVHTRMQTAKRRGAIGERTYFFSLTRVIARLVAPKILAKRR